MKQQSVDLELYYNLFADSRRFNLKDVLLWYRKVQLALKSMQFGLRSTNF